MTRFITDLSETTNIQDDYVGIVRDPTGAIDYKYKQTSLLAYMQANLNFTTQRAFTPEDFGAVGDGITDDTAAVQDCFDSADITILDKPYVVSQVSCDKYITCIGGGKLISDGTYSSKVLTITSPYVGYIEVDCNDSDVGGIFVPNTVTISRIDNFKVYGCSSDGTGFIGFGFYSEADEYSVGEYTIENMTHNAGTNDSLPQGFVAGGGKCNIGKGYYKNVRSGFVPTTAVGIVGDIYIDGATDNGVYGLGGDIDFGNITYIGSDEPFVGHGIKARANKITTVGRCSAVIRAENSADVQINHIHSTYPEGTADADIWANVSKGIYGHRNTNTTSSKISIGRVTGDFEQSIIRTGSSSGVTKHLTIDNIDINLHWVDTTVDAGWARDNWMSLEGVDQYHIGKSIINIIDTNNALTSDTGYYFYSQGGSPTSLSTIDGFDVYIRNNDYTISSVGVYRGDGQSSMKVIRGARWQTNAGPYAREATSGESESFITDAIPSSGYWREGQSFTLNSFDGTNEHKIIATATGIGSAANFIKIGGIATSGASPIGVVTPDYIGQVLRNTNTNDLYMAYGITSNTFWKQIG